MKLAGGGNSTHYVFVDDEGGSTHTIKLREWDDGRKCCSIETVIEGKRVYVSSKEIKRELKRYQKLKDILIFAIKAKEEKKCRT